MKNNENLNTELGIEIYMSGATSEQDWNNRCEEIQKANGGDHPSFWYSAIVLSGLMARVTAKFQ